MTWLLTNWRYVLITTLAGISLSLISLVNHYRYSAESWKEKSQQQTALAESRLKIISDMQAQQKAVSDIDTQYQTTIKAKEDEITTLRNRVSSGSVRLRIKAICPAGVPKTGTPSGSTYATSAELSPDARQDYYTLRSQLIQSEAQIEGLQAYIRELQK